MIHTVTSSKKNWTHALDKTVANLVSLTCDLMLVEPSGQRHGMPVTALSESSLPQGLRCLPALRVGCDFGRKAEQSGGLHKSPGVNWQTRSRVAELRYAPPPLHTRRAAPSQLSLHLSGCPVGWGIRHGSCDPLPPPPPTVPSNPHGLKTTLGCPLAPLPPPPLPFGLRPLVVWLWSCNTFFSCLIQPKHVVEDETEFRVIALVRLCDGLR